MKKFERQAQSQRKHGPLSVSGASKAPIPPPVRRPGWKGPGYVKKVVRQPTLSAQEAALRVREMEQVIPENLQQLILDVFRETLPESNDFDAIKPALREIKDAIAQRDFERAFGTEESLERYAIRWSPSSALACSNILAWICREWEDDEWVKRFNGDDKQAPANAISFGRGAAGFMALVALLKHLHPIAAGRHISSLPEDAQGISKSLDSLTISESRSTPENPLFNISLVDTANWSNVISKLHHTLTTPPPLSQYASAKARASNTSPVSRQALNWNFNQLEILECRIEELRSLVGPDPTLLTLFFTLSDLYSASTSKASAFLLKLTAAAPKGSLLLVVDSPEAYVESRVQDNEDAEEKGFPMHWLMYQILLPRETQKTKTKEDKKEPAWEKLVEDENSMFKLPKGLMYPGSLENIKFQMHLLRRL